MKEIDKINYYVRCGEIPNNERSSIFCNSELIGQELGVSCYDADVDTDNKTVRIKLDLSNMNDTCVYYLAEAAINGYKYIRNPKSIAYQKAHPKESKDDADDADDKYNPIKVDFHVYLITGTKVGVGASNEPVIRDIKVVKTLSVHKIKKPKTSYILTYDGCL